MLVTLIGKNNIHKLILPQNAIGSYWISDKTDNIEKKLINIEGVNGNWQIKSNNFIKIINSNCLNITDDSVKIKQTNDMVAQKITLKEYGIYCVSIGNMDNIYILSCLPVCETNFMHLDIKHPSEINIGSSTKNQIVYQNSLVKKTHARIFFNNGRWMVENFDSKYGTFVNNKPIIENAKMLFNGDIIFIMGLKIIIMGNSIFVNNPSNRVDYDREQLAMNKSKNHVLDLDEEEDENIEVYAENDYYARAPRITNKIEKETIKIDPPPTIQDKEQTPMMLVLGSTLSMGLVMIISMSRSVDGLLTGTAGTKETIFTIFMSFVMLIGMLIFPILNTKYERRKKIKYEEKRQFRYKEYINSKIRDIDAIMNKQRNILFNNYVSLEKCSEIILHKDKRLWERKIDDYDFLSVRLGIGDVPLDIDIQYPEEKFAMEDDNLIDILNTIVNKSKVLNKAPIVLSLLEKNVSGLIVQDDNKMMKIMQNIIMQLITFHSYEDLKLVFLIDEDKEKKWEYIKMLPHIWNNTKEIRFFADNYNDMKEVSTYLEEEIVFRLNNKDDDYKNFMPYYLIITDDYRKIESLKAVSEILGCKKNIGFSMFCIANNLMQLPNECKTFIEIGEETGTLFESEISSTNKRIFTIDDSQTLFFDRISREVANVPIKYTVSSEKTLPNVYNFLEMYDVGRIEQLNILERWSKNDSTLSLRAPIGIDSNGNQIALDIHEKFHGPHGLIAGSTGSGKSEFIITYILSLAINYHPDDVSFILIDYKGGGLAGAFQKREIKLPHLVGTITNIDTVGLQRSLSSIQSELRRRQIIFNEARNMTEEGTIDIYKYQKLYHEGIVKEPVPHLLIICDEFAELKQQQEDFMDELISVARIGRSLGVHLILATQKPAGIVNGQIRSNSKFAVCLKVQEKEDSTDVIKRPDAANLKNTGRFYLQVGNDEYFVLGQSAWSGAQYFPTDVVKKKIDTSIDFISNIGTVLKKADDVSTQMISNSNGEQLTNIVKYIYELAKHENIEEKQLWLDNIPETIYIKDIKKKYNVQHKENIIDPVIGEYDDPYNQRQGIASLNLSSRGNTVIFGSADSGKETLLGTMVYDIMTSYSIEETEIYILDFGSEALKVFKNSPIVGDVIFLNDEEKITRFFDMIQNKIRERKTILSDYNGDYNLYIKTSGKSMPLITVVLNNYEAFNEEYNEKYEELFLGLTRECIKYGIVFVMTASNFNDIRYRLSQNFKQKIALQLNNEDDYMNIFDKIGKKRPSNKFGRGLITLDKSEIYEFQTAKICEPEKWNEFIIQTNEKLKEKNKTMAKDIAVLPHLIKVNDVKSKCKDLSTVPIGIIKKNLKVYTYDITKNLVNMVVSKNIEDAIQFISSVAQEIEQLENVQVTILDAERILLAGKKDLTNNYREITSKLNNKNVNKVCIIIGIDKFINSLDNGEEEFIQILKQAENAENCNFILLENATKMKDYQYNEWYKKYILGDRGIWVGNGIQEQYLLNINLSIKEAPNNCGDSFGYVIDQSKTYLIKLLGIKDKDDDEDE